VASFGSAYTRVMHGGSASHAWIALHRLVEAYCRTTGRAFAEVFSELEQRFAFTRRDRNRWPDLAVMRAAATMLHTQRLAALVPRRAWAARRRQSRSHREPVPAGVREAEARARDYAARIPNVGAWGWRRRRKQAGEDTA
jgi:hypothetical protein